MTKSLLPEHKREIYDRYGREGLTGAGRWSARVPAWEWVREGGAGKSPQCMLLLRFLACLGWDPLAQGRLYTLSPRPPPIPTLFQEVVLLDRKLVARGLASPSPSAAPRKSSGSSSGVETLSRSSLVRRLRAALLPPPACSLASGEALRLEPGDGIGISQAEDWRLWA